ncbi:hypothetical protein ACFQH2_03740 [Natronoarchaeum sp. GCM10025703]|uniref:hypothetical protein n=1 Tax=Natronoarchaeum sp. GCM10025703 TaxID=3252685 RepID=UPI00361E3AEE
MLVGDDTTFERYLGDSDGPMFLSDSDGLEAARSEVVEFVRRTVVDANTEESSSR